MERAHKYEFEGKVRYSEIDHRATMTLPGSDTARSIITGRSHCRELSIIFRTAVPFSPSNSDMEWMC